MTARVIGRFAPSPTGPLHLGSLVAALGSWLAARAAGGRWLVRIEDLDRPRCLVGMDAIILRQLLTYGLEWDGAVWYQSRRDAAYAEAFDALQQTGNLYPCACTRSELAAAPRNAEHEIVYPGSCRTGLAEGRSARAWRVRVDEAEVSFDDAVCGRITQALAREVGDFVVKRADGLFAYQLAVVVDDAYQGVTQVVRGVDLLGNTPRQIYLQRLLNLPQPAYAHLPLVLNRDGQKLSKQTLAPALPETRPERALADALGVLGLVAPEGNVRELLAWAQTNWDWQRIPRRASELPSGHAAELPSGHAAELPSAATSPKIALTPDP